MDFHGTDQELWVKLIWIEGLDVSNTITIMMVYCKLVT
jgi:hypothetical protein